LMTTKISSGGAKFRGREGGFCRRRWLCWAVGVMRKRSPKKQGRRTETEKCRSQVTRGGINRGGKEKTGKCGGGGAVSATEPMRKRGVPETRNKIQGKINPLIKINYLRLKKKRKMPSWGGGEEGKVSGKTQTRGTRRNSGRYAMKKFFWV